MCCDLGKALPQGGPNRPNHTHAADIIIFLIRQRKMAEDWYDARILLAIQVRWWQPTDASCRRRRVCYIRKHIRKEFMEQSIDVRRVYLWQVVRAFPIPHYFPYRKGRASSKSVP